MIVWLASFPGSGSQIVRQELRKMYDVGTQHLDPRVGIARRDSAGSLGSTNAIHGSIAPSSNSNPLFIETHEMSTDNLPAIYVVRDGRETLSAFARFIINDEQHCTPLQSEHAYLNTLRRVIYYNERFGGWSHHVASWTRRLVPTAIIRYEQLAQDPARAISIALNQLGVELIPTRRSSPNAPSTGTESGRGTLQQFERNLPPQLESLFWKYHGRMMSELGYSPISAKRAA